MTERSTISQVVQIGVETTPGTAVAANKRFSSLGIDMNLNAEVNRFRPTGSKYMGSAAMNREWAVGSLNGMATYDEIIYPLSSVLTAGVHSSPDDGEHWVFTPSNVGEDSPKTFTIQSGSGVRAHRMTYGLVTEFGLDLSRGGANLTGSLIGQRLTDGITLTSSPTTLPQIPMLPGSFDVYVDDTFAALGTTKLGRALTYGWRIGNRYNPLWVIDSSKASFAAHVEIEPSLETTLLVEADSAGMAYLDSLRNSEKLYVRLESIGPKVVDAGTDNYRFTLDQAVRFVASSGFSDSDGVYAIGWTIAGTTDDDFGGGPLSIEVVNSVAAL